MIDKDLALRLISGKPWHHKFEIVPGVVTSGSHDPSVLWRELKLPADMQGITLADVGASNGYFSFEARKRGAEVIALDFRHKDNSGFGLAQYINGMNDIEHHQVNVLDISQEKYGQYDIVLCLGLLYHTSDPYLALVNCGMLSKKRLLIESYCVDSVIPKGLKNEPVMRFIPDPSRFPQHGNVNNDSSNFWGFTSVCLQRMVEDIGFKVVRMNVNSDRVFIDAERVAFNHKDNRLNMAYGLVNEVPVGNNLDDPEKWIIF